MNRMPSTTPLGEYRATASMFVPLMTYRVEHMMAEADKIVEFVYNTGDKIIIVR